MAWFYEIRDSHNAVVETEKGFATHEAAINAGRKRAFVSDDEVKSVNGDVQLASVLVDFFVSRSQGRVPPKLVDGHPLDGAHVHNCVAALRVPINWTVW